jgi:hypothetical protein
MLRRTGGGIGSRWASAAALLAGLLFGAPSAQARDLVGLTQARFTWTAASGPVAGYRVYVERNWSSWAPHPTAFALPAGARSVVVSGNLNETYRVQVAAIDGDGREGPRSNPSEHVTFKAASSWSNPAPWTPPPPPPPPPDSGSGSGSGSQTPPGSAPDFDGDGIADLLLREASMGGTMVWVMSAEGPRIPLRIAFVPLETAIVGNGDYDGDGHADLLLREDSTGSVSVQLVDGRVVGGGTVTAALSFDWELSGSGDFNADGRDDILARNASTGRLEVWFMNGPQIRSRAILIAPFSASWQVVGVADFSGDELADILWYNPSTNTAQVSIFGSWLQIHKNLQLFQSSSPADVVAVGDADGNGLPDVVTRHRETGRMRVWFTQVDWNGPRTASSADLAAPNSQAEAALAGCEVQGGSDFDGDGRMDLVLRDAQGSDMRAWFLDGATVRDEVRFMDPGPTWVFEGVGLESPATHR